MKKPDKYTVIERKFLDETMASNDVQKFVVAVSKSNDNWALREITTKWSAIARKNSKLVVFR